MMALVFVQTGAAGAAKMDFGHYVDSLYPAAAAAGVTWETFERATAGLAPDTKIAALTKQQPEFKRSIGQYIDKRVVAGQIANGKKKAANYGQTLTAIEGRYGVDPYVVVAIWGMETNYGGFIGNSDILRSLATLAYIDYRRDLYESRLALL